MAFENSTFNLFTDEELTTPYAGISTLVHYTDLSDNPQIITLYLGSLMTGRLLQAASNPGVDDIELTPTDILPEWDNATAYVIGDKIQPVSGNTFVYVCTDAGISGGSEPSWPTVGYGSTVVDGGVIWALYAKHHEITEIKLATSELDLDSAEAGTALSLGTEIEGGVENAVAIYIQVDNAVNVTSNNADNEEISLFFNTLIETAS